MNWTITSKSLPVNALFVFMWWMNGERRSFEYSRFVGSSDKYMKTSTKRSAIVFLYSSNFNE